MSRGVERGACHVPPRRSPSCTWVRSTCGSSFTVTFLKDHAKNVGDSNDQSGDRASTTAARNGVTSSQVIEFTRVLGDTNDESGDIKEESPHASAEEKLAHYCSVQLIDGEPSLR